MPEAFDKYASVKKHALKFLEKGVKDFPNRKVTIITGMLMQVVIFC
jgi:hypothetical protein